MLLSILLWLTTLKSKQLDHPKFFEQIRVSFFLSLTLIFQVDAQRCSVKKGALKSFAKFTEKLLCQSLFFNKVASLNPATLLKRKLWHRYFPVSFAKFQRTPFLTEHLRWLPL